MNDATTLEASRVDDGGEPAPAARSYLVVREEGRTQVIDIDEGADILLGRSSEATVRIEDAKASREHARVRRRAGALSLVELGSRNGTRLNEETVRGETRALRSGDRLRIGAAEILVAETAGVASQAPGGQLDAELQRILGAGGQAVLLRLSLPPGGLLRLSELLAGAALVEAQGELAGDYACLLDDPSRAASLEREIQQALPAAVVGVARAPDDGRGAAELWQRAGEAGRRGPDRRSARPPMPAPPGVIVGDPAMVRVFELVRKVAAAPTTVLILGETGAGKEVVAEQIHRQSPRASGPFVRLNCGSLPETLLESELFGHEKGAFTGADRRKIGHLEAAHGGTIFLDEIGELAPAMQIKLLRVLEDHRFLRVGGRDEVVADLRVLAATNRDLEEEVKASRFRADLYFRLSAFVIRVPPLRERAVEIELLAELFARQFARRMNVAPPVLAPETMRLLRAYPWPGNVRELRNAMEHVVVLAEGGALEAEHLPEAIRRWNDSGAMGGGPMREQLADLERRSIQEALDAEDGNQTRAARRLGISRRALLYKLDKYDLKG